MLGVLHVPGSSTDSQVAAPSRFGRGRRRRASGAITVGLVKHAHYIGDRRTANSLLVVARVLQRGKDEPKPLSTALHSH